MTELAETHLSHFIWQTRYRDTDARPPREHHRRYLDARRKKRCSGRTRS
jgi:hypothetical protein